MFQAGIPAAINFFRVAGRTKLTLPGLASENPVLYLATAGC